MIMNNPMHTAPEWGPATSKHWLASASDTTISFGIIAERISRHICSVESPSDVASTLWGSLKLYGDELVRGQFLYFELGCGFFVSVNTGNTVESVSVKDPGRRFSSVRSEVLTFRPRGSGIHCRNGNTSLCEAIPQRGQCWSEPWQLGHVSHLLCRFHLSELWHAVGDMHLENE